MIKIVVDLLGADKPQTELVLGASRAISENKDLYVYLMGRKTELEDFLANVTYDESQLEIVDCTQEITNCLLYTFPSPRDPKTSRMPSSA